MTTPDRVVALSEQLIQVHQSLRERLTSLRQAAAGGTGHPAADAIPEDLLSHCLVEDHGLVAGILRRIRELLTPGQPPADLGALVGELDGLTAILESHFGYEERRIAKALDTLGPEAWVADVFVPSPP